MQLNQSSMMFRLLKLSAICLLFMLVYNSLVAQEKNKNNLPIGVFDSGTGGLTVLEAMLTLDAFNNLTGKPGSNTSQTRPTCLMEIMPLKTRQSCSRNMW
jgi:hypothetical protein